MSPRQPVPGVHEHTPANHRKGSCLAKAFRISLYGVAVLLAVGSLISWVLA